MSMKEIGQTLAKAGYSGVSSLLNEYTKDIVEIERQINSSTGLKADLKIPANQQFYDSIRFSAFAYDHTMVSLIWGAERAADIPTGFTDKLSVSIPQKLAEQLANHHGDRALLMPITMIDDDGEETAKLLNSLGPLIESGRIIVRPQRGLMVVSRNNDEESSVPSIVPVNDESPLDHWQLLEDTSQYGTQPVILGRTSDTSEHELFEVSYPFLAGIPFEDLAKLLDDEEHHLAGARASLRKAVEEAKSHGSDVSRIVDEVLRPELDRLGRRLQTLSDSQAIKRTGAFVGIAALSFATVASSGVTLAIAAAAGAGGFGLLAKLEAEHIEKVSEAEDNPHYFLWRCRETKAKSDN